MNSAAAAPQRLSRSRLSALTHGLPLLAAVCFGSAAIIHRDPASSGWEAALHLVSGLACLALMLPVRRAVRSGDRARQEQLGALALVLVLLLFLQRIATLLFVTAVAMPEMSLFRPVYAFLPGFYLGTLLLLPSRRALATSWLVSVLVAGLTLLAIWVNGWTLARNGLTELLYWLLLGSPLMLVALRALPGIEAAMLESAQELRELRERTHLLDLIHAEERRFNLVVDSLQVGVWDQRFEDGELAGRWWSPRYYQLLGYTPEELPPDEDSARRIMGEDLHGIRQLIYRQLRERDGVTVVDARLLTKDRGWRWFNISAKAEFDGQGRFARITGAIEDIHARRSAEQELMDAQSELAQLAYRDPLTELPNRRAFDEQLQREWERAHRVAQPLSLLVLDLDWFKSYNDRYGHPAGDDFLRRAAASFRSSLHRPGDLVCRVGGEEFFVLLPETDAAGAHQVAVKLEANLRGLAIPHADSPLGVVTCSVGVATVIARERDSAAELVRRADAALYRSKREGRGRVSNDSGLA